MNMCKYPTAPEYVFDNLDSLLKLRQAMSWDIGHVAELADMGREYYNNIELGYVFPSRPVYNELAKIFDWEEWA